MAQYGLCCDRLLRVKFTCVFEAPAEVGNLMVGRRILRPPVKDGLVPV